MNKTNIKSALAGLALGVAAMLAMGAGGSNPVGRFQVAGGTGVVTILDTVTGRAWVANVTALGAAIPESFTAAKGEE